MNRSTNLLYKTNARFNLSDSFGNSFNLQNPMRGFQQHYAQKGDFVPANQINDPFSMKRNIHSQYSLSNTNYLKQYDEFPKTTSGGYNGFFPNSSLNQNQSKPPCKQSSKFAGNLVNQPEGLDEISEFSLPEAFQQSQIQFLTNQQFIYPNSKTIPNNFPFPHQNTFVSPSQNLVQDNESSQGFQYSTIKSPGQSKEFSSKTKFQNSKKAKINPKVERFLEEIEKLDMNSISLLNEVSGKLKKKVDYKINENSVGRTKNFDCICLIDGSIIGTKNGNSKQNAKAEAAKEGIRSILSDDKYLTESAAIILSIQKANEKNLKQEKSDKSTECSTPPLTGKLSNDSEISINFGILEREHTFTPDLSKEDLPQSIPGKELHHHKSALYELNIISRRLSIEPIWSFPFEANEDGDFEVSLQFGDLLVQEKGKKKQEAKKEAAVKMLEKIKDAQKLDKPIAAQPGNRIQKSTEASGRKKNDRTRALFQKSIKPNFLGRTQLKDNQMFQPITEESNFEDHIKSVLKKYEIRPRFTEGLQNFFQKIMNYTSIITSNPKQIMLDAEKHLADFIRESYLIPVGSFALGTMRNDKLIIDTLLFFQEVKNISDIELLELYKNSLEVCYGLDQLSGTNVNNMKFQFAIQSDNQGNYLEITEVESTGGLFKLNVRLSKRANEMTEVSQASASFSVSHIQKIYDSLDHSLEELNNFRSIRRVMKKWIENSNLEEINSEVLDAIVLSTFLRKRFSGIQENVLDALTILRSESLTMSVLSQFDNHYLHLFQGLSNELKRKLTQTSQQSLMYISNNNFTEALIF